MSKVDEILSKLGQDAVGYFVNYDNDQAKEGIAQARVNSLKAQDKFVNQTKQALLQEILGALPKDGKTYSLDYNKAVEECKQAIERCFDDKSRKD